MNEGSTQLFGGVLRRFRHGAGLTQEDLAERAGLSVRTISDLERGLKSTPQASTLEMLAEGLSLSPEDRETFLTSVPKRRRKPESEPVRTATSTLPAELTPLVGREKDEAAAVHILTQKGGRLLTLIGPGGVGKTRLAIRAASTLSSTFEDGARFVSLAACPDPERLAPWIARALNVKDDPARSSEDNLRAWLEGREILVLLDNFEHLISAAPLVSRLLESCSKLAVLVTSRSPLHLRGEYLFDVPALLTPPAGEHLNARDAMGYSAIALFVQRAQAVRADFELTDDLVAPVAAICRKMDSLPLALELAAAQTRKMHPESLLRRLDRGLTEIPPGPVDAPFRHQTMQAAIAWSHDLLEPAERRLFRSLSVFVNGFILEAAEAVDGSGSDTSMLLDALVDKNLVVIQKSGEARFSMLETVREYSRHQAELNGETADLQARHADFFGAMATASVKAERESGASAWSDRMLADHENFLAALRWLTDANRVADALQLAAGMVEYWIYWGYVRLGRAWMERLMDLAERNRTPVPTHALAETARLAWLQNDYARATGSYEAALAGYRLEGNQKEQPTILNNLGTVAHLQNDYDRAETYYQQAIEAARAIGSMMGMGMPLTNLGIIASQRGDYARAAELLDQGLAVWRELRHDQRLAVTLGNRGSLAFRMANYDEAAVLHKEALTKKRALGDKLAIAYSAGDYGLAEIERGKLDSAQTLLREALGIFEENGQRDGVAECLESLARVAHLHGDGRAAARLYGGGDALRQAIGISRHPADVERYERCVKEVRESMSDSEFRTAWALGEAMPVEELVRIALSSAQQPITAL